MAVDEKALETITNEVKSFGDDVKGIKDSMQKDLHDVRQLVEEAKGAIGPEIQAKIDAMTASVVAKHEASENELKGRIDELSTAMSRSGRGNGESATEEAKAAVAFFEAKAAAGGNLNFRNRPDASNVDMDGYKAWGEAFGRYLRVKDERELESKALSVGSNPDGGYLVPTATSNRIIEKIYESSPMRRLATVETIGTEALEIPVDLDEAGAGWVGEEQSRPETSTPQVGVQKIPVHEIYAKPLATQKFLEDAGINVEQWLAGKIGDRFARIEATAFMTGNGILKPRGILSYPAGEGRGKVLRVNSGSTAAITADSIVKMPFAVKAPYLTNANWLMKRSTVQAVMLLKDGQGQYLWRPSLTDGAPSTLAGYTVEMADDMPAVASGTLPIAFGDFRRGYTVVDRLGITTLRDPYSSKPFVEFYSRKRVGGDVVDFDAFALMVVSA